MAYQESKKLSFESIRSINGIEYLLSSNPSYLNHKRINAALDSPDQFWAQSLSESNLKAMLDNSFCLGLYTHETHGSGKQPDSEHSMEDIPASEWLQIGLARLITDHVTFAWLTDVYVLPAYQRRGLGKWIVEALEELFSGMPDLRRAMLIAEMDGMGPQYVKSMGCKVWENGRAVVMQRLGPAGGTLGAEGG